MSQEKSLRGLGCVSHGLAQRVDSIQKRLSVLADEAVALMRDLDAHTAEILELAREESGPGHETAEPTTGSMHPPGREHE